MRKEHGRVINKEACLSFEAPIAPRRFCRAVDWTWWDVYSVSVPGVRGAGEKGTHHGGTAAGE